ncbi:MAG: hypothetical protein ACFB03_24100 [Paracoccaceae bacterium]
MDGQLRSVLFVCTGNVFRSLTAERALIRALGVSSAVSVASAGIEDVPDLRVRSDVAAYLASHGLDVADHQRRTVTPEIVAGAGLIIAMNSDHQCFLADRHAIAAPLYTAAIGGAAEEMPDVDDLFHPDDYLSEPAKQHVRDTIDRIIVGAPALAQRIQAGLV